MQASRILRFLDGIKGNNDRRWFNENKAEYLEVKRDFEEGVGMAIARIAEFDGSVSHLTARDTTYRFYRDTRFSPDKSPYKRHFGAYIAAHGKKSLHGGYYLHMEPGNCMVCLGCYCLPTKVLTACRNEIMANLDAWREAVEDDGFVELFGRPGEAGWGSSRGFGQAMLKVAPAGFPRDFGFMQYLRMKDYCCWRVVGDGFYEGDAWLDKMARICQAGKPMMDFINSVVDDYE